MSPASSATAFSCLALGLADLLYLNLAMAPALFEEVPIVAPEPATPIAPTPITPTPITPTPIAPTPITPTPIAPTPIAPTAFVSEPIVSEPFVSELIVSEPALPEPIIPNAVAAPSAHPAPAPVPDAARRTRLHAGPARGVRRWSVTVSFAHDRDELTARARAGLDRAGARLAADPSATAWIDGHADRAGDSAHNLELSQRRAERVADHLAALGIDRRRMIIRGLGERRPLERDADAAARRRDRRVVVRVAPAARAPALHPEEEAP